MIALLSTKGGIGKTALATALAVETGAVLLDLDPQSSACRWRDRREAETPVVTDVAPARLQPTLEAVKAQGVADVILGLGEQWNRKYGRRLDLGPPE